MDVWKRTQVTAICVTHDVDEAVLLSDRIVMMTNGPAATIGEILDITLPRPRDRLELAEDPDFVHARQQVLEFLYAKHTSPEDNARAEAEAKKAEEEKAVDSATTLVEVNSGQTVSRDTAAA